MKPVGTRSRTSTAPVPTSATSSPATMPSAAQSAPDHAHIAVAGAMFSALLNHLNGPRLGSFGTVPRNSEVSTGDRVSAFSAEMATAAEMVTANCRNSSPVMPGRKATGAKIANSTSVVEMIGPVT
jgi:hypothetical protein